MGVRLRAVRLAWLIVVMTAAAGEAEIVTFTSGRTLSVAAVRLDGRLAIVTLRGGGEIVCSRSLIARIEPDETAFEAASPGAPDRGTVVVFGARPFSDVIAGSATRHGVDVRLLHAVIETESAYRPDARSPKGAMGLMQLMPATARHYGVRNPYDPQSNVEAGTRHLRHLLERFDLELALAAYNAGEEAVRRFGGIPPFRETRGYVRRVLERFDSSAMP